GNAAAAPWVEKNATVSIAGIADGPLTGRLELVHRASERRGAVDVRFQVATRRQRGNRRLDRRKELGERRFNLALGRLGAAGKPLGALRGGGLLPRLERDRRRVPRELRLGRGGVGGPRGRRT